VRRDWLLMHARPGLFRKKSSANIQSYIQKPIFQVVCSSVFPATQIEQPSRSSMSPRAPRRPTKFGNNGMNGDSECGVIGQQPASKAQRNSPDVRCMFHATGLSPCRLAEGPSPSRLAFSGRTRGALLSEVPVPKFNEKNS
jgi:hypothetical protein